MIQLERQIGYIHQQIAAENCSLGHRSGYFHQIFDFLLSADTVTLCSSVKKVDTFKLRNLVIVLLLKARRRDVANRAVRSLPVVEELNVAV